MSWLLAPSSRINQSLLTSAATFQLGFERSGNPFTLRSSRGDEAQMSSFFAPSNGKNQSLLVLQHCGLKPGARWTPWERRHPCRQAPSPQLRDSPAGMPALPGRSAIGSQSLLTSAATYKTVSESGENSMQFARALRLRTVAQTGSLPGRRKFRWPADYQSAVQQVASLRYAGKD